MQEIPTRQEMFDRAVRGLRAQGWRQAIGADGACRYRTTDRDGKVLRCAWGHVDTSLSDYEGSLTSLRNCGYGIAGRLDEHDASWAQSLQMVHDRADSPAKMEAAFRQFGLQYGLAWPEEETPKTCPACGLVIGDRHFLTCPDTFR